MNTTECTCHKSLIYCEQSNTFDFSVEKNNAGQDVFSLGGVFKTKPIQSLRAISVRDFPDAYDSPFIGYASDHRSLGCLIMFTEAFFLPDSSKQNLRTKLLTEFIAKPPRVLCIYCETTIVTQEIYVDLATLAIYSNDLAEDIIKYIKNHFLNVRCLYR